MTRYPGSRVLRRCFHFASPTYHAAFAPPPALDKEAMRKRQYRLLEHAELSELMLDFHKLLNGGLPQNGGQYAVSHRYSVGDCIFIDNLAIAHRASLQAHTPASTQGLRILHRSTVKAMQPFAPPYG